MSRRQSLPLQTAKNTLSCKRYAFAFVPFALWFKSQAFSFLPLQPFRENLTPPLILCSGPISEGSTRTVLLFLYGDLLTTFTIDDNPRNHTRTAETIYYLCSPTHELFLGAYRCYAPPNSDKRKSLVAYLPTRL